MKNILLLVIISIFGICACQDQTTTQLNCDPVEIPALDTTKPVFTWRVWGPELDTTFQSDNWQRFMMRLLDNESYQFEIMGIDSGGVARMQLQLPAEPICQLTSFYPDNARIRDLPASRSLMLEISVERSDAGECLRMGGSILTGTTSSPEYIGLTVFDFGGDNIRSNQASHHAVIYYTKTAEDVGVKSY